MDHIQVELSQILERQRSDYGAIDLNYLKAGRSGRTERIVRTETEKAGDERQTRTG